MHFDMQTWSKQSAEVNPIIRMGKKGDLSDIDCGIDVGARQAGLSFSQTADLQGFLMHNHLRKWSKKEKTSSEQQFCGQKCFIDARGQRRMVRLVWADRKATVTQITTHCNRGLQKHTETWSRWTTAAEDHNGCHSCQETRATIHTAHQNWTIGYADSLEIHASNYISDKTYLYVWIAAVSS